MDMIKAHYPDAFLLLTFYSPSGFEHVKNKTQADSIQYLPLDFPSHIHHILSIVQPKAVIIIKYELWLNWLKALHKREIPVCLISANMGSDSSYLKGPFSPLYLQALRGMNQIFTQAEESYKALAAALPETLISLSSDTRYDRVQQNRKKAKRLDRIEDLIQGRMVWIAGSTYEKDESMILQAFEYMRKKYAILLIFAPHEIQASRIEKWVEETKASSQVWSRFRSDQPTDILWIDHIGWLSSLYQYGNIAFIGGGWGSGLHNILEAATFGCPVLFGPNVDGFPEATDMMRAGGAFLYHKQEELHAQLERLMEDSALRHRISRTNQQLVDKRSGASKQIFDYLKSERLLP